MKNKKNRKGKYRLALLTLMLGVLLCLPPKTAQAIGKAVILEPESATMYTGGTKQLQMYVGGGPAAASGWTSTNKKVAAVSKNGVVTAKKAGKAVIRCKTGFGYDLTCKITVKKKLEISGYLEKNYKKLAKKAPEAEYQNAYMDPAGIGNVYVFKRGQGVQPFFRYDKKTKKISFLQLSDTWQDERQRGFTLYGVSLGMTAKQAKAALGAKKCKYTRKQVYGSQTSLYYVKKGHTIRVMLEKGKVAALQWSR